MIPPLPARIAWALLFWRVAGSALVLAVHGLPKLLHWPQEVLRIEDPFGVGAPVTLGLAVFAEVLCPVLIIVGVWARLACLPLLAVLVIALGVVHPEWSLEESQFAWLLLTLFAGLALAGPGPYVLRLPRQRMGANGLHAR